MVTRVSEPNASCRRVHFESNQVSSVAVAILVSNSKGTHNFSDGELSIQQS